MAETGDDTRMTAARWRRVYEGDYDRRSYLAGEEMVTHAETFFDRVGTPETVASVGCGPAVTELELADRFPETTFACYDVAERVVEDDRDLASERGIDNVSFEVGSLPDLALGRRFDVVYCVATLYFVADVEAALRSLYDHVDEGGHLVASYPTERLRDQLADAPESKQALFEPVVEGRNVTTAEEIARLLDAPVESYWSLVGADEDAETVCVRK